MILLNDREVIQQAMGFLSPRERDVICKRHYQGWTFRRIAKDFPRHRPQEGEGVTVATIAQILNRAERKLKNRLKFADLNLIREDRN